MYLPFATKRREEEETFIALLDLGIISQTEATAIYAVYQKWLATHSKDWPTFWETCEEEIGKRQVRLTKIFISWQSVILTYDRAAVLNIVTLLVSQLRESPLAVHT